eukprot:CAMPEP_0201994970 /NCGR_PEP_ID=MMETSP0905-20130828/2619_1 /ASSEMBLY_ACC=CAM_ASM_000554 /TAXON_ID=420261 /ORGANISM="Thalassiosira antarctica, Strain CCMP982" /LENGTH=113 /DNA_ID=CAMNT_0048550019 /DNA_START=15 /DNA_END=354 /DNA_ORIENTATION=-
MADGLFLDDLNDLSDVDPEEEPSYEDRAEAGSSGDGGASHDAAAMGDGTNRTSSSADGNAAATTKQRPRLLDPRRHLPKFSCVFLAGDRLYLVMAMPRRDQKQYVKEAVLICW